MKEIEKQKILEAGKIASQVRQFAKTIIKKDVPLLEIAEKIEAKIIELKGKPAFPVNTSINEIAAHYTPSHDDETKASGLLKIDFGVHVDGFVADTAMSFDLENSEENKKLIEASQESLNKILKKIKPKITTSEIGKTIQETIESKGFIPIINLSGHSIEKYELHSGITIPNVIDSKNIELEEGLYAIEPFATLSSAGGKVNDGKPSGIYSFIQRKPVRSPNARKILDFIEKEYSTLPFCSRWIIKKFGAASILALRELENSGSLHHFNQLVESTKSKVSQAEHTILIEKDKVTVTTI